MTKISVKLDKNMNSEKLNRILSSMSEVGIVPNVTHGISLISKDFYTATEYKNTRPDLVKIYLKDDIIATELINILLKYNSKVTVDQGI